MMFDKIKLSLFFKDILLLIWWNINRLEVVNDSAGKKVNLIEEDNHKLTQFKEKIQFVLYVNNLNFQAL